MSPSSTDLPSPERLQQLLFDAARLGRDDVIPALLRAGVDVEATDARGYSALVLASYAGHESSVRILLDAGAMVDGQGSGSSALMGVAFKGHDAVARLLLDRGADPNRRNGAGQTALMMAALVDRGAIVDLLLAHGADASTRDAQGRDAASLAAGQGNQGLADLLAAAPIT